jgi:hypothetical protein
MRRSESGASPRRLPAALGRDDVRAPFVEGLLLGAIVGAAIAGSTLWQRWRAPGGRVAGSSPDRLNRRVLDRLS